MFARSSIRLGVATAAMGLFTAAASTGIAAASTGSITETDPLTWSGIGDAQLGDTGTELVEEGLAEKHPSCDSYLASDEVPDGVHFSFDNSGTLREISLTEEATNATEKGARADDTYGELRTTYGDDFSTDIRDGSGGPVSMGMVTNGDKELAFLGDEEMGGQMSFEDSDQFERVILRDSGAFLGSGC